MTRGEHFSKENRQELTDFYYIHKWKPADTDSKKGKSKGKKLDPRWKSEMMGEGVQKILWEQPHSTSDQNIPAKLSLCVGLPVMIRNNDATECCITKGAEATVASWQSSIGPYGQKVLDTLFVKLKHPP